MADVFISYKREERARILEIAAGLEKLGVSVWFDARISARKSFDDVIEEELHKCKAVLACWSPKSVKSKFVRSEATVAEKFGKLISCRLAPVDLPTAFILNQTEDLSDWKGEATHEGWRKIVKSVGELCNRPGLYALLKARNSTEPDKLRSWAAEFPGDPEAGAVLADWIKREKQHFAEECDLALLEFQAKSEQQAVDVQAQRDRLAVEFEIWLGKGGTETALRPDPKRAIATIGSAADKKIVRDLEKTRLLLESQAEGLEREKEDLAQRLAAFTANATSGTSGGWKRPLLAASLAALLFGGGGFLGGQNAIAPDKAAQVRIEGLNKTIDAKNTEIAGVRGQLDTARGTATELQGKLTQSEGIGKGFEGQLNTARSRIDQIAQERDESLERLKKAEDNAVKLAARLQTSENNAAAVQTKLSVAEGRAAGWDREQITLSQKAEKDLADERKRASGLQSDLDRATRLLREATEDKVRLVDRAMDADKSLDAERKSAQSLRQQLRDALDEVKRLKEAPQQATIQTSMVPQTSTASTPVSNAAARCTELAGSRFDTDNGTGRGPLNISDGGLSDDQLRGAVTICKQATQEARTQPDRRRIQAQFGRAMAEFALRLSMSGNSNAPNIMSQAVESLKQSADDGSGFAMNQLGSYFNGSYNKYYAFVDPSPSQAFNWWKRSAEHGNAAGRVNYAVKLIDPNFTSPTNPGKAGEHLNLAEQQRYPRAFTAWADGMMVGEFLKNQPDNVRRQRAAEMAQKAACAGDPKLADEWFARNATAARYRGSTHC